MNQALKGIRVLDLTMNLPGPYMTWLMAEMGAEVLKNPPGAVILPGRFRTPKTPLIFRCLIWSTAGRKVLHST